MQDVISLILNPALISIIILCFLCLKKVNVLLAILVSALTAGILSGLNVDKIMSVFISGMGGNSETALSYILLGAFAATMSHSGFTAFISKNIIKLIKSNKYVLFLILCLISMASQNIIPIHIAFIPILIPPLLQLMNKLQIDRRAVACILAYGLKMPYIVIPAGFGLIFQNLLADNIMQNGVNITRNCIWKYTLILGIGMTIAMLIAVLISYRKPRNYNNIHFEQHIEVTFEKKYWVVIFAALVTFIVQLLTQSLPLGALIGLGILFSCKVISKDKIDSMMNEGIYLMGYIAFVMLVAAGYSEVLKSTGAIDGFVHNVLIFMPNDIFLSSLIMLIVGLFITIGIGSSFGTIPILSVLFVPICLKLGFNIPQIIILLAASAALGDAGSPASDTTLGPTSGLNNDNQHNHIFDTCIPTFLHFNLALIISALIGILLFN